MGNDLCGLISKRDVKWVLYAKWLKANRSAKHLAERVDRKE
ncbi:hypothetical protein ALT1644_330010 [Alteromonas macleodii]